jgi:hypothetical protein
MGSVQNLVGMASCLSQLSRRDACPTRLLSSLIKLFVNPYTKFRSVSNEEQSTLYRYGLMYLSNTFPRYTSCIGCSAVGYDQFLIGSPGALSSYGLTPPHPRTYLIPLTHAPTFPPSPLPRLPSKQTPTQAKHDYCQGCQQNQWLPYQLKSTAFQQNAAHQSNVVTERIEN